MIEHKTMTCDDARNDYGMLLFSSSLLSIIVIQLEWQSELFPPEAKTPQ